MTLLEVLDAARPPAGDVESAHRAIRRRCWVVGHRIQWWPQRSCWLFGNAFSQRSLVGAERHRQLPLLGSMDPPDPTGASQGLLTPDSMLADDWELA